MPYLDEVILPPVVHTSQPSARRTSELHGPCDEQKPVQRPVVELPVSAGRRGQRLPEGSGPALRDLITDSLRGEGRGWQGI